MKKFFCKENMRYLIPTVILLILLPLLIRGFFINLEEGEGGAIPSAIVIAISIFWIVKNIFSLCGHPFHLWQAIKDWASRNKFCVWVEKLNTWKTILYSCILFSVVLTIILLCTGEKIDPFLYIMNYPFAMLVLGLKTGFFKPDIRPRTTQQKTYRKLTTAEAVEKDQLSKKRTKCFIAGPIMMVGGLAAYILGIKFFVLLTLLGMASFIVGLIIFCRAFGINKEISEIGLTNGFNRFVGPKRICSFCGNELRENDPGHIAFGRLQCIDCYNKKTSRTGSQITITQLYDRLIANPAYIVQRAQGKDIDIYFIELIINSINSPIYKAVPVSSVVAGEAVHCRFAITDDEVEWTKNNINKLDKLAAELEKHIPGDRLIEAFTGSANSGGVHEVFITSQCETMDNYKYRNQNIPEATDDFEQLKVTVYNLKQQGGSDEQMKAMKKQLGAMLLEKGSFYCLYDADCNNLPYVDTFGHLEIYSRFDYANDAVTHFKQANEANVIVSQKMNDLKDFIYRMAFNGVAKLRLDNGHYPVEFDFAEIYEPDSFSIAHVLDALHRGTRGCLIRLKQLEARKSQGRNGTETVYPSVAPIIKKAAYEQLSSTPVFVLSVGVNVENATMYTKAALEQIEKLEKPVDTLIASGKGRYATIEGNVSLKLVVGRDSDGSVAQSHICAFTNYTSAEEARKAFGMSEDDGVLVMTFEEVCKQALCCKGIVVDCTSYGYEILTIDIKAQKENNDVWCNNW